MVKLKLDDYQIPHANRIENILKKHIGCLDTSTPGLGKTIVFIHLAKKLGYRPFIVCPKSVVIKWEKELNKYNVEYTEIITYNKLAGKEKIGCKHPWLVQINKCYTITEKFKNVLKKKCFLVFDEIQMIKKESSARSQASYSLARSVVGTVSRTIALSNTPIDQKIFAPAILRTLGIIRAEKMYKYDRSRDMYTVKGCGIAQLMGYCRRIDSEMTDLIKIKYPIQNKTNLKELPYILYTKIIKKVLISSMVKKGKSKITMYKDFFHLSDENVLMLEEGYRMIRGRNKTGNNKVFGNLTGAQLLIETAKLPKMISVVTKKLDEEPSKKYILFVIRKITMNTLKVTFDSYGAVIINSDISSKQKEINKIKFQNDDSIRVLISSTKSCGTGIDLDDKVGNRPRVEYIMPDYRYIDDYQGAYRVCRQTTKSKSEAHFMYCGNSKLYPQEKVLINQETKSIVHENSVNNKNDIYSKENFVIWYEDKNDMILLNK